jgi:hypothetical protein
MGRSGWREPRNCVVAYIAKARNLGAVHPGRPAGSPRSGESLQRLNAPRASGTTGMLPQIKNVRGLDGGVGVSDRDMHGPVFLKAGILRKFNKLPAGTSSSIS